MAHPNAARPVSSAFWEAVLDYRQTRATQKKKPGFLDQCIDSAEVCSVEEVQNCIADLEKSSSNKPLTRVMRKILKPVISVLSDYAGVLDVLCNADPMPTALIWGVLKATIECSNRYLSLYEKISSQLGALTNHLHRLILYEDLFAYSIVMREELKKSYINVLRFWSRVAKECNRNAFSAVGRAVTSFSTKKMDKILDDLGADADVIAKLVPLVQQQEYAEERKKTDDERRLATAARAEISSYILEERNSRLQRETERKRLRQKDVRDWIRAENGVNITHFQQECSKKHSQTCNWIHQDCSFIEWRDRVQEQPILWLRGPPGVGKSVMTAHVIETVQNHQTTACVAYQYYSSNEQYSALDTFRNIADQLLDQFWDNVHDIPDHIHAHIQHTRCDRERILKLIELLSAELNGVYIFLDGLDEACDNDSYWREVKQVLLALGQLSSANSTRLRLWISSQDRAPIRKSLPGHSSIEMTVLNTATDISTFLYDSAFLEGLTLDKEKRALIIQELNIRANGSFLYAYLMADSLRHAENLKDLVTQINENLPLKLDDYYHGILARIDRREYALFSKILMFVTFAKRPLRFTELREAIGIMSVRENEDLTSEDLPAMLRINQSCEPLIKILGDGNDLQSSAVTLSHSTVRAFLLHHPHVFRNSQIFDKAVSITEDEVSRALLHYLQQPRYCYPLEKGSEIWQAALGEDVGSHYLLTYAAKYWDKHSDKASADNQSFQNVLNFVQSPQFAACLQVQSLSVEGHFGLYLPKQVWAPPHMKRIFPRWFSEGSKEGKKIYRDYQKFAGEWGAVLENKCLGGLDHCLLGSLGSWNFLGCLKSRYKSFILAQDAQDENTSWLIHETFISADGSQLLRVLSQNAHLFDHHAKRPDVDLMFQTWSLQSSPPKLDHCQDYRIEFNGHRLPMNRGVGAPLPIKSNSDLTYLRIGSQFLRRDENCEYVPVVIEHKNKEHLDDLASNRQHLAIAWRGSGIQETEQDSAMDGNVYAQFSEFVDSFFEGGIQRTDLNEVAFLENSKGFPNMQRRQDSGLSRASSTHIGWSSMQSAVSDSPDSSDSEYPDDGSVITNASMVNNSAYEWESMVPTSDMSNESSDHDEWNESTSSESSSGFDVSSENSQDESDYGDTNSTHSSKSLEGSLILEPAVPLGKNLFKDPTDLADLFDDYRGHEDLSISKKPGKVEMSDSEYNISLRSDETEWSSNQSSRAGSEFDSDGSNATSDPGQLLDDLIGGKANVETGASLLGTEGIRIYDTSSEPPVQIFHYSQYRSHTLYSSPPVFHPSQPLLVWSLGGGEIVFTDFLNKTFFSRRLNRSSRRACYISIRFHFSSDGHFLHIAALEARKSDEVGKNKKKAKKSAENELPLRLLMQVSTHRLSVRKPTRCAPRLIFRSQVNLGTANSIPISRLPYTLTWSDEWLYITHNDPNQDFKALKVFRAPLHDSSLAGDTKVDVLGEEIYLPRSSSSRTVYYFPPKVSSGAEVASGTVILSSTHTQTLSFPVRGHTNAARHLRPHSRSLPPIGFSFSPKLNIRWTPVPKEPGRSASSESPQAGGRLQRKFERFDKQEDQDIIAYLS